MTPIPAEAAPVVGAVMVACDDGDCHEVQALILGPLAVTPFVAFVLGEAIVPVGLWSVTHVATGLKVGSPRASEAAAESQMRAILAAIPADSRVWAKATASVERRDGRPTSMAETMTAEERAAYLRATEPTDEERTAVWGEA